MDCIRLIYTTIWVEFIQLLNFPIGFLVYLYVCFDTKLMYINRLSSLGILGQLNTTIRFELDQLVLKPIDVLILQLIKRFFTNRREMNFNIRSQIRQIVADPNRKHRTHDNHNLVFFQDRIG